MYQFRSFEKLPHVHEQQTRWEVSCIECDLTGYPTTKDHYPADAGSGRYVNGAFEQRGESL